MPDTKGGFANLRWHLAVAAVLEGAAHGHVVLDSEAAPTSGAVLVDHRLYLAGEPGNRAFLAELRRRIGVSAVASGQIGVYPDRPDWREAAERSGLVRHLDFEGTRRYYRLDLEARQDAGTGELPDGFRIVPADRALVEDENLGNQEALLEEMESERESVADFLARSFGVVLLRDRARERAVAGWCLSEYNLEGRCEVGIGVDAAFRRRGLATLLGRAFLRQAQAAGMREIGWHCWARNATSCATAQRLGFTLVGEYPAFVVRLGDDQVTAS